MNVLRISSDLYPYVVGGIGLHSHLLSEEQVKDGHNITVYTCLPEKSDINPMDVHYNVVNFGRKFQLFGNTFCLNMFWKLFRNRYNYDIIDGHSHLFISTNIAAVVRRLGSAPLVITNHGLRSQAVPAWFQEIYLKTVGRFTFNSADKVITFTEREKEDMVAIGVKPEKIVIIPNGVDTDVFHPVEKDASNPFTVIWVGRLSAGKGLKYAILGFEKFLQNAPSALMYVVGDGPYLDAAQAYVCDNGLDKSIIFTGRVDNEEMLSYYTRSSVYLMTSMSEGMPRTLLEAMACGLPVVCTDIPQLVPIIEAGGIVIQKKDVDEVVAALERLYGDVSLSEEFGLSGRKMIEEGYSLSAMNAETEKVYEELTSNYK
ncbi:MAG: glycosyltransferase family 4 protein [Methanocorpusculum sp.]|nr:glycosyltransferase family 4 protein [Methanocorpusculum sp.]MBQ4597470.1 glycosyltransferase family 4 protein [Methanocorpusculum sp.]